MKYYIFDLDGTLADSMGYWYGSFREDERGDKERMRQVRLAMKEKYADIIQPRPGAIELLERLYSAGAEMCIASATDRRVSEPFMLKYGLYRFFRFYLDCTEAGAHKDKPDIYLQAAERLGASPPECTVVEDSAYCAETTQCGFQGDRYLRPEYRSARRCFAVLGRVHQGSFRVSVLKFD